MKATLRWQAYEVLSLDTWNIRKSIENFANFLGKIFSLILASRQIFANLSGLLPRRRQYHWKLLILVSKWWLTSKDSWRTSLTADHGTRIPLFLFDRNKLATLLRRSCSKREKNKCGIRSLILVTVFLYISEMYRNDPKNVTDISSTKVTWCIVSAVFPTRLG